MTELGNYDNKLDGNILENDDIFKYSDDFSFDTVMNELNTDDGNENLNDKDKKYSFDDLDGITTKDILETNKLEINGENIEQLKNLDSGFGFRIFQGDVFIGQWENGRINGQGVAIYKNGNKYIGELSGGDANNSGMTSSNAIPYVLREGEGTTRYKNGSEYRGRFESDRYTEGIFEYNGIKLDVTLGSSIKAGTNTLKLNEVFEEKKVKKLCTISSLLKDTVNISTKKQEKSNSNSDFLSSNFGNFGSNLLGDNKIILVKKDGSVKEYGVDFIDRGIQKDELEKWLNDYLNENNK